MEEKRVTDFGCQEVTLVNGTKVKIRPFTFKEKNEYLKMCSEYGELKAEDVAVGYIKMQIDVAFFIISKLNPEITKEMIEENVNGEIFKQITDIAFYDPFNMINPGR